MRSPRPSSIRRLGLQRLEPRTVLAIDIVAPLVDATDPGIEFDQDLVFVTSLPGDAATDLTPFATGFPESDPSQPWIAAAAEGEIGAVVIWLKLTVDAGVTSLQAVPIWARWNPLAPCLGTDPAEPIDAEALAASVDGLVFGGPGSPLDEPLAFADLADFTPPLEDGVQEYFLVARSSSDFALAALAAAILMIDQADPTAAPPVGGETGETDAAHVVIGLDSPVTAADETGLPGEPVGVETAPPDEEPSPEPLAWLGRLRAERPWAAAGDPAAAFPVGADGPAWLVAAQAGEHGTIVLWVSEADVAGAAVLRVMPVWLELNPPSAVDPGLAWTDDAAHPGTSSTVVYAADAAAGAEPLPPDAFGEVRPPAEGEGRSSLVVMHSASNAELVMTTLFTLLAQAPAGLFGDGAIEAVAPVPLVEAVRDGSGPALFTAMMRGLDQPPPPAPPVRLRRDTGQSDTDRITRDGRLEVDTAPGFRARYSTDGGTTWRRTFRPSPGDNTVQVRQVARGGIASPAATFQFTLDRRPPAAPRIVRARGRAGERAVLTSARGNLAAIRVEPDAHLLYSFHGGPWTSSFAPPRGPATLRVRQIDLAGNVSRASLALPLWHVLALAQGAPSTPSSPPTTMRLRRV